jgi:hypothetical protein
MPADGNGTPRPALSARAIVGNTHPNVSWLSRRPPGPVSGRRPRVDPAEEAMSRNPNLSPPIHFGERPR